MPWIYEGKEVEDLDPKEAYGFIYEIENLITGRKYIGMKFITKAARRQVKGKVKKFRTESDWKDYWGSCQELLDDIQKLGEENFKKTILRLCKTRGETKYQELVYQVDRRVLESKLPDGTFKFYNGNIGMRHTRRGAGIK